MTPALTRLASRLAALSWLGLDLHGSEELSLPTFPSRCYALYALLPGFSVGLPKLLSTRKCTYYYDELLFVLPWHVRRVTTDR